MVMSFRESLLPDFFFLLNLLVLAGVPLGEPNLFWPPPVGLGDPEAPFKVVGTGCAGPSLIIFTPGRMIGVSFSFIFSAGWTGALLISALFVGTILGSSKVVELLAFVCLDAIVCVAIDAVVFLATEEIDAYVIPGREGSTWWGFADGFKPLSTISLFLASGYDRPSLAFIAQTSFSRSHTGHSLEVAAWAPPQFTHFGWPVQSWVWSTEPHRWHATGRRHVACPWP